MGGKGAWAGVADDMISDVSIYSHWKGGGGVIARGGIETDVLYTQRRSPFFPLGILPQTRAVLDI